MVRVDPSSWMAAGRMLNSEATRFATDTRRELGPLVTTVGQGGIPILDELIAGILPAVMEAVDATIDGISENLAAEGDTLMDTGETYAAMRSELEAMDDEVDR